MRMVFEWCRSPVCQLIWLTFGVEVKVRWDEEWVTYTVSKAGKLTHWRAHEEDIAGVRAQVMAFVLATA